MASIKSGNVSVSMSGPFEAQIRELVTRIAPGVESVMRDRIDNLLMEARANWIVRSGLSLDSLSSEVRFIAQGGRLAIKGIISNSAPYAYAIRIGRNSKTSDGSPSRLTREDRLWTATITDPFEAQAGEARNEIIRELSTLGM